MSTPEGKPQIDMKQLMNQVAYHIKSGADDVTIMLEMQAKGIPNERIPSLIAMTRKRLNLPTPGAARIAASTSASRALVAVASPAGGAPGTLFNPTGTFTPQAAASLSAAAVGNPMSFNTAIKRSVVAGLIAALVGGLLWGGIIVVTEHEFGILAWAMGAWCAVVIYFAAPGARGPAFQVLASVAAIFGIILGNYIGFSHAVGTLVKSGELEPVGGFSVFFVFLGNIPEILGLYGILWVILAVVSACKILSAKGSPGMSQFD